MSCVYGVITTLVNLTNCYDKQEIIPEMLELAKFAKQHIPEEHPQDSKEYVEKRIRMLMDAGVTVALVALSKTGSKNSKELISRVFNSICEHKDLRGTVVQHGGTKVLIPMALEGTDKGKLHAAQALARIGININPEVAFPGQRAMELIRPLLQLLHPECSALQNFEALLCLCNLAGLSESVRNRIITEKGVPSIENYMYEDHELLKRASVQAMVNLITHNDVMHIYEGKNDRVKYWTLLCMDEDAETALAASGGLALLTASSKKCCKKVFEAKAWLDALRFLLANENKEMQYRGTCIVSNMMSCSKAVAEKLIETDIMELLLVVSRLEGPDYVKAKGKAEMALKSAEEWKLIAPSQEGDDSDVD